MRHSDYDNTMHITYFSNKSKNNDYSRSLDIHLTTDHPEINKLVEVIFHKYFNSRKKEVTLAHLKVLLLHLYLAWNTDPKMEIGVYMSPNSYTTVKRYNKLYITKTMIDVVTILRNHNVINFHKGSETNHKVTHIWASPTLANYFKKIGISIFEINQSKELIVLRDKEKKDIDYRETSKTRDMRRVLGKYNEILSQTFIDIPFLEKPYIEYKGRKHFVNQHSKLVRRIFNNGTFNKGGRFYGGWWQHISEKQREKILMDDREIIEINYKSLHPILAYANKGIDFWKTVNVTKYSYFNDSYDVPTNGLKDKKDSRTAVKLLFSTALNAKNEKECFKTFRDQWDYEYQPYTGLFSDTFLKQLLDNIRDRHYQIDDMFCSGFGIDLQKWDNDIIEYIVSDFTERNIPILCIHDSFIIWKEQLDLLVNNMNTAIKWVTGIVEDPKLKYDQFNVLGWKDHIFSYLGKVKPDRDYYIESIPELPESSEKCKGYKERWKKHKNF